MDTLTHALSGALLARATAPAERHRPGALVLPLRARMTAGFFAAAFPDSDFVLRAFDTLTYVALHRGVTHSILLLPAWAWAVAWMLALLFRFSSRRFPWQAFYGVAAMGIGIHIAGDVITSYGTMVLAPFSDRAVALPLTFIIDPWFTGIIIIGLVACRLTHERYPSIAALAALGCYVGFQAVLHSQAIDIGRTYIERRGLANAEAHAFPQPLSPFNWKIIVRHGDEYDAALVNLRRTEIRDASHPADGLMGMWDRMDAAYRPASAATWKRYRQFGQAGQGGQVEEVASQQALVREAWSQEIFARFRQFARFPVLDRVEPYGMGGACVSFFDLRFTVPSLPPSLVFGLCRDTAADSWRLEADRGLFGRQ